MPSTTKKTSANPKQAFGDKKPPLALLPLVAHIHGAMAFYDGAGKYGKYNWRENPVEADTYVQAMLRHARLWENGEEVARDTGVHNLGGVIACAALLLDAQANGTLIDNRVRSQAACDLLHEAEDLMSSLKEQHAARREAMAKSEEQAYEDLQAVEADKREQAFKALNLMMSLRDAVEDSPNPETRRIRTERYHAAQDVILNMVNGVFPEDPYRVVSPIVVEPDLEAIAESTGMAPGTSTPIQAICDHDWVHTNYGRSCKNCGHYDDV